MNEKIKEFMRQCEGKYCLEHDNYFYDMEKFAELIVQECAKIADGSLEIITMKPEWPSKYIKQHFGVAE